MHYCFFSLGNWSARADSLLEALRAIGAEVPTGASAVAMNAAVPVAATP